MKKSFFILLASALVACQTTPQSATLTILHTNDTHSQIEPISSGSATGQGGYARRMGLIEQERSLDPHILLLDAGDFSQGTPYFNYFHGRVEVDAMNRMGYDVVTLGNHEFDNGVDTLAAILREAKFAVVSSNYQVDGTPLEGLVKPYVVLKRQGLRIGVLGLGVQPKDLIAPHNFAPVVYLHPLEVANEVAQHLREREHCDLVICLSHLGTQADKTEICDEWLATNSRNIDIIIGGHTHKVVENHYIQNLDGKEVLLGQMGKAGARLGKITLSYDR